MYSFTFIYDAEDLVTEGLCNEIEVTVTLKADREYYDVSSVQLYDLTADKALELSDLSKDDQEALEEKIETNAYNHAGRAAQNYIENASDQYDWRDDR